MTVSLVTGCRVKLIGDYDDTIDKGISDLQQKAELYFSKLQSAPMTPYDQNFYDDMRSRLAALYSRGAASYKKDILVQQISELQRQFSDFQKFDQSKTRPIGAQSVTAAESAVNASVESILKLELALKRGASSAPAPAPAPKK
jgi:hypothetical protein